MAKFLGAFAFTLSGLALLPASAAEARIVMSRVELLQTGESARVNSPECQAGGNGVTTADILLKLGSRVIDHYTGNSFTSAVVDRLSPGNRDWLKGRLGIHDGKSSCVTQCVIHPLRYRATYKASFSETGGDGYSEKVSKTSAQLNGDYGTGWSGVINSSTAKTRRSRIFCATGKNWSHNRNRWFTISATY